MQLSVIIVNFNVRHFLEHCLWSVSRACEGIEAEIIVVDNNSTDDSVEMVRTQFPEVVLLANTDNPGFAKANNQGVSVARGKYILYLNPDTIVPEDCFVRCLSYMEQHPEAGALGCRLIDGKGQFLPESKRGFPSAWVAFCKISGLSALFPRSRKWNQYHMGFLPEHEICVVDVLVGCFMFCRKSVIDEVGGFDTDYFMYGEDIDLSYKISKAGFKNVYFPETTVIHYKGESTKKGSLNYVRMFYQAMIIFARKHFQSSQRSLYVFLIQLAIYFKAILSFCSGLLSRLRMPLLDAVMMISSLFLIKSIWVHQVKTDTAYSTSLLAGFFMAYILIWISSMYFSGAYDKPYKAMRLLRGMLIGGIVSVALYGLLDESIRFSRGITVLGALGATLLMLIYRQAFKQMGLKALEDDTRDRPVVIVGTLEDEAHIRHLFAEAGVTKSILGSIHPLDSKAPQQVGIFAHLSALCRIYGVHEIIYCRHHLSFAQIIQSMQDCGPRYNYKLHSLGTQSIIGSNSKDTAGDLYTTELVYQIAEPASKRNKRFIDVLISLLLLLLGPVLVWFTQEPKRYFLELFLILEGDKTFVGYDDPQFPALRPSVFTVYPDIPGFEIPIDNREHLNYLYAHDYSAWTDLKVIWNKWHTL